MTSPSLRQVYDASASAVEAALIALDTIQEGGVEVDDVSSTMSGGYATYESLWAVTFVGSGVGGDVESLVVRADDDLLSGSGAHVRVRDARVPFTREGGGARFPV